MRDQARASVRRAARVTLVACLGFYTCRYWLNDPTTATYALFGTIAMGVLAQIPGPPAERARTLLAILPVGYLLVTAGTLLSVSTWSAVAGTFAFGFLISFAGVGGPRLVGMGAGVQPLYILPCFPPYDPGALGHRLAGPTIAVVLLAVAERVLWPDPAPVPYPTLLAGAFTPVAACLLALADQYDGDRRGRHRFVHRMNDASRAAEVTVPSRPVSASRRDRALSQAGGLLRLVLFTLVISLVFAQLAPVNWQLATTRVIDVAVGTAIGALIGLVAWPRGSTGELHHATARPLPRRQRRRGPPDRGRGGRRHAARHGAAAGAAPGSAGRGVLRAVPERAARPAGRRLAGRAAHRAPRGRRRRRAAAAAATRPAAELPTGGSPRTPRRSPPRTSGSPLTLGTRGRRRPTRAAGRPTSGPTSTA